MQKCQRLTLPDRGKHENIQRLHPRNNGALGTGKNDRVRDPARSSEAFEFRPARALADEDGRDGGALPAGQSQSLNGCFVAFVMVQTTDTADQQPCFRQTEAAAQCGTVGGRTKNAALDAVGHDGNFVRRHGKGIRHIMRRARGQSHDMRRPVETRPQKALSPRGKFLQRLLLVHHRGNTEKLGRFGGEDVRVVRLRVDDGYSFATHPRGQAPDAPRRDPARGEHRHKVNMTSARRSLRPKRPEFAQTDVVGLEIRCEVRSDPEGEILRAAHRHGGENKRDFPGGGTVGIHGT